MLKYAVAFCQRPTIHNFEVPTSRVPLMTKPAVG